MTAIHSASHSGRRASRPIIPGRANRKKHIRYEKEAYKGRNVIERCYCRQGARLTALEGRYVLGRVKRVDLNALLHAAGNQSESAHGATTVRREGAMNDLECAHAGR